MNTAKRIDFPWHRHPKYFQIQEARTGRFLKTQSERHLQEFGRPLELGSAVWTGGQFMQWPGFKVNGEFSAEGQAISQFRIGGTIATADGGLPLTPLVKATGDGANEGDAEGGAQGVRLHTDGVLRSPDGINVEDPTLLNTTQFDFYSLGQLGPPGIFNPTGVGFYTSDIVENSWKLDESYLPSSSEKFIYYAMSQFYGIGLTWDGRLVPFGIPNRIHFPLTVKDANGIWQATRGETTEDSNNGQWRTPVYYEWDNGQVWTYYYGGSIGPSRPYVPPVVYNTGLFDVPDENAFIDVVAGWTSAIALKADGSIRAWGRNVVKPSDDDGMGPTFQASATGPYTKIGYSLITYYDEADSIFTVFRPTIPEGWDLSIETGDPWPPVGMPPWPESFADPEFEFLTQYKGFRHGTIVWAIAWNGEIHVWGGPEDLDGEGPFFEGTRFEVYGEGGERYTYHHSAVTPGFGKGYHPRDEFPAEDRGLLNAPMSGVVDIIKVPEA